MRAFEEQFPEALDLISRALKAGHAFATGLKMVADEMPDPVGPEFRKTFDEQNFGLPLKDALDNLTFRVPVARRPVLRHRGADSARDGRQPLGDSREPRARRARALQDPAPGPRLHGARPFHRLRAAGAAGGAVHRAVLHQSRTHEPAASRANGPDDAARRAGHADHRATCGSSRSSRSRCSVSTMLLPLLAFVFGTADHHRRRRWR